MKTFQSLLGAALVTGCALLPAQGETIIVDDSQGAMVYEFLTGWTFGTMYPDLIAAANTGPSSPHSMPSYLKFDLSGLIGTVEAGDVTSATLRLYVADGSVTGFGANPSEEFPVSVDFSLVTGGDWSKNTITYGNAPAAGGLVGSIIDIDSAGVWVELDITGVVQSWLGGDTANYGLKLTQPESVRDGTGNSIFAVFSSDGATSNQPQLVINTVPEPSTWALMGLSGSFVVFYMLRRKRTA